MNKILVAFFSHKGETYFPRGYRNVEKGNAQIIAEKASGFVGADLFEIVGETSYPKDYNACCRVAKDELMQNKRPALLIYLPNLNQYEKIILVYPCWWGTMPMPVFSFLEHYDLTGKTILPICTHEGSGMGNSEKDLEKVCGNAKVCSGLAVQGANAGVCDSKLKEYLKNNGLC